MNISKCIDVVEVLIREQDKASDRELARTIVVVLGALQSPFINDRDKIVAWLHRQAEAYDQHGAEVSAWRIVDLASAIERGDYLA